MRGCALRVRSQSSASEDARAPKRGSTVAVDFAPALLDPDQVRRALPDPEPRRECTRPARVRLSEDDELGRIPPPVYFRLLCGLAVPSRGGYVLCPLHEERTPSCMVWVEPERGWWCFGCGRGGGIYDLASLVEGGPWRGAWGRGARAGVWEAAGAATRGRIAPHVARLSGRVSAVLRPLGGCRALDAFGGRSRTAPSCAPCLPPPRQLTGRLGGSAPAIRSAALRPRNDGRSRARCGSARAAPAALVQPRLAQRKAHPSGSRASCGTGVPDGSCRPQIALQA